ncbi:MAG: serine/threonine-protein phosphatase [Prevotella sp.]|nr:serine/threonine-protein phosphatase [Prevotella sp.]
MKIKITAVTDVGKERENNEDNLMFCPSVLKQDWQQNQTDNYGKIEELGALLVVADGMGGANAGEVASALAIESVKSTFTPDNARKALASEAQIEDLMQQAIDDASMKIDKRMCEDPDTDGMGTTIVICWVVGEKAYVAWCGDSRCYVHHPDTGLRRLTKDHSLVQELVDKGEITEDEAFNHPDNNIITRGLGDFQTQAKADIITYDLHPNDTILLCSDGLCGYCADPDIEKTLNSHYVDASLCRDKLLNQALDVGGYDNIAIVLASVIGDDDEKPAELKPSILKSLLRRIMGS